MEKFNYNTDKLVIVAYPIGAGGKFLINCLGISEDACLQDWELYNLTSIEKKALILDRMVATPKCTWNDLDLGCFKQFEYNIDGLTAGEIRKIEFEFNEVIDISNGDKYFFQTTHNKRDYIELCNAFPKAHTINLISCNQLERDIYSSTNDLDINSEFTFDVTNYKTKTSTLNGIKIFYDHFALLDFDYNFISEYYEKWITHITRK